MRHAALVLALAALLPAQEVISPPQMIRLDKDDGASEILQKASRVRPHPRQLRYHQEEFIGFIHFGINTFTGREWGTGKEKPADFDPPRVDTDQWCRIMREAGMRKVIMTVKHHDGFCLWQTRYNDAFSVKASPWQDGKGDVLRQLAASCRREGLRLGIYISPADLFQIESEDGLYGNLSKPRDTEIPTDPASFRSDPRQPRPRRSGLPTFRVKVDDYNRYMMNQLYEVLTEYGPIDEVWFDGAHPKRKGGQTYDKPAWFRMVRQLQPQAVIFGGPDVRWCGNERGDTRAAEWNVLGVESLAVIGEDRPAARIGDDASLTAGTYKVYKKTYRIGFLSYLVSEVDTSLRHGWFWRNDDEQKVRSVDEIFDIYERAVGTGTVLLLNVPPNDQGRFSARDVACLQTLGARIRGTYGRDQLAGARCSVPNLRDAQIKTFWQSEAETAAVEISLPQLRRIDRFVVQEAISEVGQRIRSHALDAWQDGAWQEIARGTTVGYKRILRFAPRSCQRLRLRITAARAPAALAEVAAHLSWSQ